MTKKTIILVLIALLILNTLFWISLLVQRIPKLKPKEPKISLLYPEGSSAREYWEAMEAIDERFSGNTPDEYIYIERLSMALRSWKLSKGSITLLIITNAILVAISFMIILLYKKE